MLDCSFGNPAGWASSHFSSQSMLCFGRYFNAIQSECFAAAFKSDSNMVRRLDNEQYRLPIGLM